MGFGATPPKRKAAQARPMRAGRPVAVLKPLDRTQKERQKHCGGAGPPAPPFYGRSRARLQGLRQHLNNPGPCPPISPYQTPFFTIFFDIRPFS